MIFMKIESEICPSCYKEMSSHDMENTITCMQNFIKKQKGSHEEQSFNHSSHERN